MTLEELKRADELIELLGWMEAEGVPASHAAAARLLTCHLDEVERAFARLTRDGLARRDGHFLRLTEDGRAVALKRLNEGAHEARAHSPHGLCTSDCDCGEGQHACERPL